MECREPGRPPLGPRFRWPFPTPRASEGLPPLGMGVRGTALQAASEGTEGQRHRPGRAACFPDGAGPAPPGPAMTRVLHRGLSVAVACTHFASLPTFCCWQHFERTKAPVTAEASNPCLPDSAMSQHAPACSLCQTWSSVPHEPVPLVLPSCGGGRPAEP